MRERERERERSRQTGVQMSNCLFSVFTASSFPNASLIFLHFISLSLSLPLSLIWTHLGVILSLSISLMFRNKQPKFITYSFACVWRLCKNHFLNEKLGMLHFCSLSLSLSLSIFISLISYSKIPFLVQYFIHSTQKRGRERKKNFVCYLLRKQ